MASFLALCAGENILVATADADVKVALQSAQVHNIRSGSSAANKTARREQLAAVLWARNSLETEGFADLWSTLSPARLALLQGLFALPQHALQNDTWMKRVAAMLALNLDPPAPSGQGAARAYAPGQSGGGGA